MKNKKAFTLIEVMVVIGIIIVLAVILLPNMVRAKISSNEKAAVAACKTIANGLSLYALQQDEFPESLSSITTPLKDPPYIASNVALATSKDTAYNGYYFEYTLKPTEDGFTLKAHPKSGLTGKRHFFVDETGVIRYGEDESVSVESPKV
jgi:prepilin-type N-terminal cleavage/methylation domain-containing protein